MAKYFKFDSEAEKEAFIKSYGSNCAHYSEEELLKACDEEEQESLEEMDKIASKHECWSSLFDFHGVWNDAKAFQNEK